jgi:hypothetical protein
MEFRVGDGLISGNKQGIAKSVQASLGGASGDAEVSSSVSCHKKEQELVSGPVGSFITRVFQESTLVTNAYNYQHELCVPAYVPPESPR